MADAAQKAITSQIVKNGVATVYVNKFGVAQELQPKKNKVPNLTSVDAKYDARFDDVRYYSGDTSS